MNPKDPAMFSNLQPGDFVRLPDMPDWGLGQVQSVVGARITANFENAGKQLIMADVVDLIRVDLDTNTI